MASAVVVLEISFHCLKKATHSMHLCSRILKLMNLSSFVTGTAVNLCSHSLYFNINKFLKKKSCLKNLPLEVVCHL